jgi:arginyl-tRNA synthetase
VFYVQYAHARIQSVRKQWEANGGLLAELDAGQWSADTALLTAETELALMTRLAQYPDMLTEAAKGLAPHDVAFYLRDLASAFHSYYAAERFLVDDAALSAARIALLTATAQVLRNGLGVLGLSAPNHM